MTVVDRPVRALPRSYLAWLSGFTVGRFGDAVLAFALGWAASGLGGTTAAVVLTAGGLPRVVLLLVGGAVADRIGVRRLLITGEAVLLGLTVVLAVTLARVGSPAWLLVAASLALGTVTALCLPATGSMPRRLVPDDQLPRALAVRQGLAQVVMMVAAPLGGFLVGSVGLPGVALGAAVTLGVSLSVLVAVRELSAPATAAGARTANLGLFDGVRIAARSPGLRVALLLTGAGAGLLLPVPSLLVPLLGRASGWGPGATGAVAGAVGVGAIGAALLAARRRTRTPEGGAVPVATGMAVSAAGALVLVVGSAADGAVAAAVAGAGGLVLGFGSGMFVARVAPVLLGSAPRTHLARVQALVGLAQLLPVMVTTMAFGALAEHASPRWALATAAAGLGACAVWARTRVTA